ncbi:hypothetical protein FAQ01_04540 [Flavobacterium aquatile]|nr:hypothetical protein FAQ01_04540 [Flavobacterium aquatile]
MAKKKVFSHYIYRDAKTGRLVTEDYAKKIQEQQLENLFIRKNKKKTHSNEWVYLFILKCSYFIRKLISIIKRK